MLNIIAIFNFKSEFPHIYMAEASLKLASIDNNCNIKIQTNNINEIKLEYLEKYDAIIIISNENITYNSIKPIYYISLRDAILNSNIILKKIIENLYNTTK